MWCVMWCVVCVAGKGGRWRDEVGVGVLVCLVVGYKGRNLDDIGWVVSAYKVGRAVVGTIRVTA